MAMQHRVHPRGAVDEDVYVRSPRTAAEEAMQFVPGSRFLSTTEFKRVYLGGRGAAEEEARTAAAAAVSTPPPPPPPRWTAHDAWGHRIGPSPYIAPHLPHRPPGDAAARSLRRGGGASSYRLRRLYGAVGDGARTPAAHDPHARHAARPPAPQQQPQPQPQPQQLPQPAPSTNDADLAHGPLSTHEGSAHTQLPDQLRSRVRSARRTASPVARAGAGASNAHAGALRHTEESWLALTRELADAKGEVRSLQRQLRHAQVLLRSLHGVAGSVDDEGPDEAGVAGGSAPENDTTAPPPRPPEYWQRRAYFLLTQNEQLQAKIDHLSSDVRGNKVHALLRELEAVRAELGRRRGKGSSAASPTTLVRDGAEGAASCGGGDGVSPPGSARVVPGSVAPRLLLDCGTAAAAAAAAATALPTAVDEAFLRGKDDTIRDLRERLRLLSEQYQRTDAALMATTRRLEDMSHRHGSLHTEWQALVRLPQELARVQQQLSAAQARLLDSDREAEAFHQLFDTLESPATLRAIIEERDRLVELLRQRQQSEAALRDEMREGQQRVARAAEEKYRVQHAEAHAMARDREALHEQAIETLRKRVSGLELQLQSQKDAYEAQLAEHVEGREAALTERLLESVRHANTSAGSGAFSVSRSVSAAVSPRNTPRGGQRQPSVQPRTSPSASSLPLTPASAAASLRPLSDVGRGAGVTAPRTGSADASVTSSLDAADAATAPATQSRGVAGASPGRDGDESPLSTMSDSTTAVTESSVALTSVASSSRDAATPTAAAAAESLSAPPAPPSRTSGGAPPATPTEGGDVVVHQRLVDDDDATEEEEEEDTGAESTVLSSSSGSDDHSRDVETVEKDSGPDSGSSSTHSSPAPAVRLDDAARRLHTGPLSATVTINSESTNARSYVIDLPAAPIAMAPPVSILINRTTMRGPLFSSSLRPVVHSPDTSPQQTTSATDFTQTQHTLTSTSGSGGSGDSGSDSALSSGSTTGSSLPSSADSPHAGEQQHQVAGPSAAEAGGLPPLREAEEEEAEEDEEVEGEEGRVTEVDLVKSGSSTIYSGAQALTAAAMRPARDAPDASTTMPLVALAAVNADDAAPAAARAHFADSPTPSLRASRVGAPIPSPPALTPVVTSNLYPPRQSSSFLLSGAAADDDFGPGRGGAGSRFHSNDHNASFDLGQQFSGNASFDFVGELAERHHMEDMQNASVSPVPASPVPASPVPTSPATVSIAVDGGGGGGGLVTLAPRSEALRAAHGGGSVAATGTGAAGLRKTPSPPIGAALSIEASEADLRSGGIVGAASAATAESRETPERRGADERSGPGSGESSGDAAEISHYDGHDGHDDDDDDDDTASSLSAERVTAGTREREESPRVVVSGDASVSASASAAPPRRDAPPTEAPPGDGAVDTSRRSRSASSTPAPSPISKVLAQEDHTLPSFNLDDGTEVKSHAGDAAAATSTSAATAEAARSQVPAAAAAAAAPAAVATEAPVASGSVPSYVPRPPTVAVPAPPRASPPPPPSTTGLVPLPPRVAVPSPPPPPPPPQQQEP